MKSNKLYLNRFLILKNIKRQFWIIPMNFLLLLISSLLGPNFNTKDYYGYSVMHNSTLENMYSFNLPVVIIFSVVIGVFTFSFLFNKKETEFLFSLPITRYQLFLTRFLGGLIGLLIVTSVFNIIYIGFRDFTGGSMGNINLFKAYTIPLLIQSIAYSIGCIAAIISKTWFSSGIVSLMMIAFPYGFVYLIVDFVNLWFYEFYLDLRKELILRKIEYINPVSNFQRLMDIRSMLNISGWLMLEIIGAGIIYFIVAYYLFKRRREDEEIKFLSYQWIKKVIKILLIVSFPLMISTRIDMFYPGKYWVMILIIYVVSSIGGYILITLIMDKPKNGFKGMLSIKHIINMILLSGVYCTAAILIFNNTFISCKHQIHKEEMKRIIIAANLGSRSNTAFFVLDNEEEIREASELIDNTNKLIDYIYENRKKGDYRIAGKYNQLEILDIGGTMKGSDENKFFTYLIDSEILRKNPHFRFLFDSKFAREKRSGSVIDIENPSMIEVFKGGRDYSEKEKFIIEDQIQIEKILSAMKKDQEEMNFDQLINIEEVRAVRVFLNGKKYIKTVYINEGYTNTVKQLKKLGVLK